MHTKNNPFSNIILFQFVVLMTLDRRKTACLFIMPQFSFVISGDWCHLIPTLHKQDTYLRQTVGVGPDGVRRRD